jgi:hypothetical protein
LNPLASLYPPAHTGLVKTAGRILLAAALLAAVVGVVRLLPGPPEPVYEGRKLSAWLARGATLRARERDEAYAVVRELGTNAIPTLLSMARAYDSPLELKWLGLVQRLPVLKLHHTPANSLRFQAELGFDALRSAASGAVPDLMKIYRQAPSPAVQDAAIVALGDIGPPASDAVPLMIEATTSSDSLLSGNAVWALGQVHSRPELSLPALVSLLESTNPVVCVHLGPQAAMSLAKFGNSARPTVPHLTRLLQSAHPYLRSHITNAVKALDPEAAALAGAK